MVRRQSARPRPVPSWAGELPVFERSLPNGFKALVLPRPQAPVVVCDLYYPVGSVDEPAGQTGLAHFLEHMLFKGTRRVPKGQIDRLSFLAAGSANAETSEDCTHYWFAFPADRWELALWLEADRMTGATFDPCEVEAERHIIAEERARELDTPIGRLEQTHLAMSYLVHPYRNPVLGWPEDLRRTTAEDLRSFYRATYRPAGAVLVIVGALEPAHVLDQVEAHFGVLARSSAPAALEPPREPRQAGRREFSLIEPDAVARGLFGWHSVPRAHADSPPLQVLADLLAYGRRSRLWEHLVERERLATWVEAAQESSRLAGQFLVQVEAAPGVEIPRLDAAIHHVIDHLAHEGPTHEELSRSRNRLEAAWRWEQEDLPGLAAGLGHFALWGGWQAWQAEHRAALAVGADDIRRVASTYLVNHALTVGWSLPGSGLALPSPPLISSGSSRPRSATPSGAELSVPDVVRTGPSLLADYRPTRSLLSNGLRVVTERREGTGTVAFDLYIDAGILRESKAGLAFLAGRLREEGTRSRSAEALAAAIEDVGGTLDVGATGVSLRVRTEDLPLAVDLLADVTLRPAFPRDALPWARRRIAAELRGDRDDPAYCADLLFRSLVYAAHPYARDPRGTAHGILRLTLADILDHHARFLAPNNAFLVVVGDFEPRRLRALLERHLAGWRARPIEPTRLADPPHSTHPRVKRVSHAGEQVHLVMGHLGIRRDDPDFEALAVLDHIFGSGPGCNDRLSRILRDELGLAYTVGGGITDSADVEPGLFRVYLGTGPDEAPLAIAAVSEQIEAMHRGEFSDDEVARARDYLAGSWVFEYQTVGQRAERLLELTRWQLPLDTPIRWPQRIERITPDQVRAAARRHLHPEALFRVEYGPIRRDPDDPAPA